MITAGIDCGAKNTKTIIMNDGKIIGKGKQLTGFDQKQAVEMSLEAAIQAAGLARDDIQRICGTADPVEMPFRWQTVMSMTSKLCRKGPIISFPTPERWLMSVRKKAGLPKLMKAAHLAICSIC